jgi:hypothetical protein
MKVFVSLLKCVKGNQKDLFQTSLNFPEKKTFFISNNRGKATTDLPM